MKPLIFSSREEWLAARTSYIGGSDAACILGLNPWKTNVRLWEEKSGITKPEDISGKEVVKFGHAAEPLVRELFKLDHPDLRVFYKEHNMFLNDKYPFAHASLDGWYRTEEWLWGILEIKTTEIHQSSQWEKWRSRIPDNYYCQLLHYLAVTDADEATLRARIKHSGGVTVREFKIDRTDVQEEIDYLMEQERLFCESVKNKKRPALILPEIGV